MIHDEGGVMQYLKIKDGSSWPNPSSEAIWRLRHVSEKSYADIMWVCELAEAYVNLIVHPAFNLKVVSHKISEIRKAIAVKGV